MPSAQTIRFAVLLTGVVSVVAAFAQTPAVRGTIAPAPSASDSTRVLVYGLPSENLPQVVFENVHVCVSIPNQDAGNPEVSIYNNYLPSLEWVAAADNPKVAGGRAYYTFVGIENNSAAPIQWWAGTDNPILELEFKNGAGKTPVQLNDLTDVGGIGSGGGADGLAFWYVQANGWGDITNYAEKFYTHAQSAAPQNGGLNAPSFVETASPIALPATDLHGQSVWRLFPNPTNGPLYLEAPETHSVLLRVTDSSGRLVWEQQTTVYEKTNAALPVTNLPGGMYVLHVYTNAGKRLFSACFARQ